MDVLSKRLQAVAACLARGETVADIGADHAQLSLYLIKANIAPRVIIGELAQGPYRRACQAAAVSRCQDRMEVRQGYGLQVLNYREVDAVVLAGLGGDTIVEILADDLAKSCSFQHFVLQPMSKPEVLRQWLAAQGWMISSESLAAENRRLFVVISSQPGQTPYHLSDLECEIGPLIIRADEEIKRLYIRGRIEKYRRIMHRIRAARMGGDEILQKYHDRIQRLEEILGATQSQ